MPRALPEENRVPRRWDFIKVVDTMDEWEELIGRVEEFVDAEGGSHTELKEGFLAKVFFPTKQSDQRSLRLVGVNFFTPYIRHLLREQEGYHFLEMKNLEWVDPDEF